MLSSIVNSNQQDAYISLPFWQWTKPHSLISHSFLFSHNLSSSATVSLCIIQKSTLLLHLLILFRGFIILPANTCPSEAMPLCIFTCIRLLSTGLFEDLAVVGSIPQKTNVSSGISTYVSESLYILMIRYHQKTTDFWGNLKLHTFSERGKEWYCLHLRG